MSDLVIHGDALDLIGSWDKGKVDLLATDPPYAFGGSGAEHAVSATVAIVLREAGKLVRPGGWAVVYAASSWRSTSYMVEALRGVLEPVRIATWVKPNATSKTRTPGWRWASVNVITFRKGKSAALPPSDMADYIEADPVKNGRRAELPSLVASWSVAPFCVDGGLGLDPFAGSGALVEAMARHGMDAYGFEMGSADRIVEMVP